MIRTYDKPKENAIYTMSWDGDCYSYTVYDNQAEYEDDMKRRKEIDEEYKRKMKNYLNDSLSE